MFNDKMLVIQTNITNTCSFDTCQESVELFSRNTWTESLLRRYLQRNQTTWTIPWNTSREILMLIGPVTHWRGNFFSLRETLFYVRETFFDEWMSRTGDCCFVQWRIRTVCSWCTVELIWFSHKLSWKRLGLSSPIHFERQTATQRAQWQRNKERVARWNTFTRNSSSFKIWYFEKLLTMS